MLKRFLVILMVGYLGYLGNLGYLGWNDAVNDPDFSELDRRCMNDPELHSKISDDYIKIFLDFYKNNPKNLDMESYYEDRSKEKSTNYWKGLVLRAKFYHKNYANEMFAG